LRQVPLESVAPAAPATADPSERAHRRELATMVRRAMDALAPADREILLLRTFRELDTEEIMEILDLSAEAVRQRHSRASRRLAALVTKMLGTETKHE
jgi:RNA polymerase sigma factor (sigma-70 family)